jgi:hypothetical protein
MEVLLDAIAFGAVAAAAMYLFRRTLGARSGAKTAVKGLGTGRGCGCQGKGCEGEAKEPRAERSLNKK